MKRYIITSILAIGVLAALVASNSNAQKPRTEPEVIVNQKGGKKEYHYNMSFEFNLPACTRDKELIESLQAVQPSGEEYTGDKIFTHCKECNIGVYSMHEGETERKCTYCKAKEIVNE